MMRFVVMMATLSVTMFCASVSQAQNSGTANSTPQYRERSEKSNAQIAAEYTAKASAKARAAREAAARASKAGYEKTSRLIKKHGTGKVGGVVTGVLSNPKTACAPAKPDDCK